MSKPNQELLDEWSGKSQFTRPQSLNLDSIQLNGQRGNFVIRRLSNHKKGDEVKKENVGDKLELVFLRVRRRLAQFRKDEDTLQTNEHNHSSEIVTLFGNKKPETGVSQALRERYPGLRTEQIIYAYNLDMQEIVRFNVRGASLGSNATAKGVLKFYDYIGSFAKDEHSYEYITEITPVEETGDLGAYFAMQFKQGRKLNEVEMEKVYEALKLVGENIKELDEYYKARPQTVDKQETPETDIVSEELPAHMKEDINPDDIPF